MSAAAAPLPLSIQRTAGWALVAGIVLASLTEAIAGTAFALGRSDAIGDIHATPDEFAWLDISYIGLKLIGFALTPWLLTRVQPRSVLLGATLAMGAACALAAFVARLDALIVLRALQGLSGAALLVSGQTILFLTWPARRQPLLQALFAIGAVVAPATLAPALQGWLIDSQSWTWIFFAVLPVALLAAGLIVMSDPIPLPGDNPRSLDWPGLLLLAAVLLVTTWLLNQGSRWDWFETELISWLAFAAVAGAGLFLLHQTFVASDPLLDTSVFGDDDFTFAFAVSFVAGAALFGSAFLIPAFAVSVLGLTPSEAGQLLFPSGALFVAALFLSAWLVQARGASPVATVPVGILMVMVAMWMLSSSAGDSGPQDMMPAILIRGLGLGFLFLSITLIAFSRLPVAGVASGIGIFSIGRQLGGLIGVAGLQTVIDHQVISNHAALGAALNPGSPALVERLASTTSLLIARGVDPAVAASTAASMLGRSVRGQATILAFDTAFALIALLFVVAAPMLVAFKIFLARRAARRLRTQQRLREDR